MNTWLAAVLAVVGGVAVGLIASRLVGAALTRSKAVALRESSSALAGLVLSVGVVVGLLVALGFVAPDELDQLGSDAIGFLPKVIAALVIVIASNVASTFAAAAVAKSLAGTGGAARFAPIITKFAILTGGAIVAAGQADVDTMVVNIAVAGLLLGVAGAVALLTGLGGRQVASEIAAGRAWRSALRSGDRIDALVSSGARPNAAEDRVSGVVVEVHPTSVELDSEGRTMFVPNSRLLDSVVVRDRPAPVSVDGEIDRQ